MADDVKLVFTADTAPIDRAVRLLDNLEAELRNVEKAMDKGLITEEQFTAETQRLNRNIEKLNKAAKGSAKDFRVFERTMYNSGKAVRRNEIAFQQAGYQLQDFIVQVQGGTNPLIAFSQQGSQLAGFFAGPWGAGIGLGIAALGGLGTALLGAKGQTEDLHEELKDLIDYMSKNESSMKDFLDMSFSGPLEKARKDAIKVLEIFRKMENAKVKDSVAENLKPIVNQIAEVYDAFEGKRTQKERIDGKITKRFVLPEQQRNALAEQQKQIANILSLIDAAVKGPVKDLGIRLGDAFVRLEESGFATTQIKEQFKGLLEEAGLMDQVQERLAARDEQLANEKKAREEARQAYLDQKAKDAEAVLKYQAKLEKDLFAENAKYEKEQVEVAKKAAAEKAKNEAILNKARLKAAKYFVDEQEAMDKRTKDYAVEKAQAKIDALQEQAQAEKDLFDENLEYEKAQALAANAELRDAAEELGTRLGISFSKAILMIQAAKEEATIGLDAFGGAGSFKYGFKTTFNKLKKGSKAESPESKYKKFIEAEQRALDLRIKQYDMTDKQIARSDIQFKLEEKAKELGIKATEKQVQSVMDLYDKTVKLDQISHYTSLFEDNLVTAMMNVVDGTMSVENAFKSMMRNIILEIYKQEVASSAAKGISGFIKGLLQADGGVHSRGLVTPFANGGVVGGPTMFPMANGVGLMGEAGPEAIIPLKRGRDGKLGVEGGGGVTVVQNINISTGVQQTVRSEIRQLMPQIAESAKSAVLDSKRRGGNYGRALA